MLPWGFLIMTYLITGSLAYSTQANRNTAKTNINNVLAGYTITSVATSLSAGVVDSGTTGLTISIRCADADVNALRLALLTAWSSAARATTGHWIAVTKE